MGGIRQPTRKQNDLSLKNPSVLIVGLLRPEYEQNASLSAVAPIVCQPGHCALPSSTVVLQIAEPGLKIRCSTILPVGIENCD